MTLHIYSSYPVQPKLVGHRVWCRFFMQFSPQDEINGNKYACYRTAGTFNYMYLCGRWNDSLCLYQFELSITKTHSAMCTLMCNMVAVFLSCACFGSLLLHSRYCWGWNIAKWVEIQVPLPCVILLYNIFLSFLLKIHYLLIISVSPPQHRQIGLSHSICTHHGTHYQHVMSTSHGKHPPSATITSTYHGTCHQHFSPPPTMDSTMAPTISNLHLSWHQSSTPVTSTYHGTHQHHL